MLGVVISQGDTTENEEPDRCASILRLAAQIFLRQLKMFLMAPVRTFPAWELRRRSLLAKANACANCPASLYKAFWLTQFLPSAQPDHHHL